MESKLAQRHEPLIPYAAPGEPNIHDHYNELVSLVNSAPYIAPVFLWVYRSTVDHGHRREIDTFLFGGCWLSDPSNNHFGRRGGCDISDST